MIVIGVMSQQQLDEWKFSTIGKIFAAGIAAYLVGRLPHLKIRGSQEEIDALQKALQASKIFNDELKSAGGDVDAVIQKLKLKNVSAAEFARICKVPWPL